MGENLSIKSRKFRSKDEIFCTNWPAATERLIGKGFLQVEPAVRW